MRNRMDNTRTDPRGKTQAFAAALCAGLLMFAGCKDLFHPDGAEETRPSGGVQYTVSYEANGGSGTPPDPQTVNAGESLTLAGQGDLTHAMGYAFIGWNSGEDGTGTLYNAGESYTPPTALPSTRNGQPATW